MNKQNKKIAETESIKQLAESISKLSKKYGWNKNQLKESETKWNPDDGLKIGVAQWRRLPSPPFKPAAPSWNPDDGLKIGVAQWRRLPSPPWFKPAAPSATQTAEEGPGPGPGAPEGAETVYPAKGYPYSRTKPTPPAPGTDASRTPAPTPGLDPVWNRPYMPGWNPNIHRGIHPYPFGKSPEAKPAAPSETKKNPLGIDWLIAKLLHLGVGDKIIPFWGRSFPR